MENYTCGSDAIKILLVVVIVALVIWIIYPYFKTENFKQDIKIVSNFPTDYKEKEIPVIRPPSYDADTMAIQAGADFIPQKHYFTPWGTMVQVGDFSTADGTPALSSDSVTDYTMNFNQCSPACCSDQWPVPFKIPTDKMLCNSEDVFVPTSYFCNNGWQNSGCLCMTKQQSDFLQTRGNNSDY